MYNGGINFGTGGIVMYDKEKGKYPAGMYLVGRDLPLGNYILTTPKDRISRVSLYASYKKFMADEEIFYTNFEGNYHLALIEENTFLVVENADLQKL